jgi:hypothetical protein
MGRRKKSELTLEVIPQRNFIMRRMQQFFDSDEGKSCLDVSILKSPEMKRFLENRLHIAFIQGVAAGEMNRGLEMKAAVGQQKNNNEKEEI